MIGLGTNPSSLTKASYLIVTLVFVGSWVQLLVWGYHYWSHLLPHTRTFFVGMALLYPIPWVHMTIDRKVKAIVLVLSSYLVLELGVLLICFLGR